MSVLQVSPDKTHFICEGQPFFYLADTVWSAFTSVTEDEWEKYLNWRKMQGFNALQINVLNQWDASVPYLRFPFRGGQYGDFELNEEYFDFAEKLLEKAVEKGFIPALVLLWCNFVPDTWASRRGISPVMPFPVMERYVEYVAEKFSKFNPIFVISGDTDFGSQETIRYYLRALEIAKSIVPSALTTFHLNPSAQLPSEIVASPYLDFYMYQSGHVRKEQHLPYFLAQRFLEHPVRRPIVNGEPCYEGHPFGFTKEGRFSSFDVRKAVWQSLLSGASAGVTYGAHGIWSWHRKGLEFKGHEFSGEPFEWDTALYFEGAWDVGFAKHLFEQYELFGVQPAQDLLVTQNPEVRCGITKDAKRWVVYSPSSQTILLKIPSQECSKVLGIELTHRKIFHPLAAFRDSVLQIDLPPFNSDFLLLGRG